MKIHLSPKCLENKNNPECELVDVQIEELALTLTNGQEITTCRPYPNKNYVVACANNGTERNGLLIDTSTHLSTVTVVTRWKVEGEEVITHTTKLNVVDSELEAISDNMMLWCGFGGSANGDFRERTPASMMTFSPLEAQPVMQTKICVDSCSRNGTDTVENNFIKERVQYMDVPTIEVERLSSMAGLSRNLPKTHEAFKVELIKLEECA